MYGKHIGYAAASFVISAVLSAACGAPSGDASVTSDAASTSAASSTGLPCDVSQVLADNCQVCHASSPKSGAGSSLVTWDDLQKPAPGASGSKVGELLKKRIHDDASIMPPRGKLPDASLKILDAWVASGMPRSSTSCDRGATPLAEQPLPCTPDVTIKAAKPYAMPAGRTDQYVCVGFDVNVTQKRHIIALGPHVDNARLLHHLLLFQTKEAYSPEPTECTAFGSAGGSKLMGGWAPGGGNIILPPEAAYPENPGTTHWMLQLHYNNAQNIPDQVDNSGFSMCSTEQLRPNDAGVVAFGSMDFTIPPRSSLEISCDVPVDRLGLGDVTFFSASPHMHKAGTSMSTERVPQGGNGMPEMVYAQPNFAFENQEHVKISAKTSPGDVMRTRCGWKNPGDSSISFGENTGDEMCFHFMSYYPEKPSTLWALPSLLATCGTK